MNSRNKFRRNTNKHGGGIKEDNELFSSVISGQKENVLNAIRKGANIDARDDDQYTPLHHACDNGHLEVVMALIEVGANVNVNGGSYKNTPLHFACDNGHLEVAMALIEKGADIDARDDIQNTPLHLACWNSHLKVAMALIDKGAAIDARNADKKTPLHLAFRNNDIEFIMALVEKGADINASDARENTPRGFLNAAFPHELSRMLRLNREYFINKDRLLQGSKRNFITTKNNWKIYLDDKNVEEFENLNGKYEVDFADGTIYKGDWKDNKKHGKGKSTFPDGEVYEGDYKDGKKHGKGTMTWADGDIYEGDYKDDKRHGKGKMTFPDGQVYEGDHQDDKRNGKGKLIYTNGNIYEGEFKDNKRNGEGKLIYANGGIYEGEFKDSKKHGKGTMTFANGDIYEGDYQDDKRHGKCTFKWANGDMYEGPWNDKFRHGKDGKMTYANDNIYEGDWKDDKMHGRFKVTYKKKDPINVEYDENYVEKATGELYNFKMLFVDNTLDAGAIFDYFKGKIENGFATGQAIFIPPYKSEYRDAKLLKYTGGILNNKREGKSMLKYDNENPNKVTYKNDQLIEGEDGEYFCVTIGDNYFDNFNGKIENGFATGKGVITAYMADLEEYNGDIVNNKKHGKGEGHYQTGSRYNGDWVENKRHGKGTYIWEKGSIYEGDWNDDKKHGKGKLTWANGVHEGDYKDDKMHGYGVFKFQKDTGPCPAGSTYEGYWKNGRMETEGNEVSKLTWPAHDSSYPDKSMPCGLRSFEGKWINNIPQTPRAGYEDILIAIENWGNYVWESNQGRILLDQAAANAYEVHQKGSKMKQKLDPVLKYIEELTPDVDRVKIQELIQQEDPQKVEDAIFTMFNDVGDLSEQQTSELRRILYKIKTSQYITDRNSKEIIIKCVVYATNINIHDLSFIKYYINIFIEENIRAYNGPNGISCTAGIFERFFTVLQQTINLAIQTGDYTGNDPEKQERLKQYNEILNEWGLNKPDMSEILATFNGQHESILSELLEGKKQPEKVRKVIEFIKAKYQEAQQDPINVEAHLDEYLQTISINRDGLFAVLDSNEMFGGKRRKHRRKTRRRIQKKTKRIVKKKAKRTHKKKSKNTKSRR